MARDSKTTSRDVQLPSARTLGRFLTAAQKTIKLKGQVTVLLTTDAAIRKLNKQFRGKDKATDVLSFPAAGLGAEGMAGDLAISVTTALKQAAEQGHTLSTEIKVLVLHGLLHLAGYDHEADEGRMERRERALRARLGLPQGLIERAGQSKRAAQSNEKKRPSGAKAHASSAPPTSGLKPGPTARTSFSTGAKAHASSAPPTSGLKPGPSARTGFSTGAKAHGLSGPVSARLKSSPFKTPAKAKHP